MLDRQLYDFLRRKDGINQDERSLPALAADAILLDERSQEDILTFFAQLAEQVNFFGLSNQVEGDWIPFFRTLLDNPNLLQPGGLEQLLNGQEALAPHLTLWLACLEIFQQTQADFNQITARHLRHYYEKILQTKRLPAKSQLVHLLFELNRNQSATLLEAAKTTFPAGEDPLGNPVTYQLAQDMVVNPTEIGAIHSIYVDQDAIGRSILFATDDAKGVLAAGDQAWRLFGASQLGLAPENQVMQAANIGFAVAAPILKMAEGIRAVTATFALDFVDAVAPAAQTLDNYLTVSLTGAEGWHEVTDFSAEINDDQEVIVSFRLDTAAPAIVGYDAALHEVNFKTEQAVLQIRFLPEAYQIDTFRDALIETVNIEVAVEGVTTLVLQNDQGLLIPDQPVNPFGSRPRIGSRFYVGSAEVFSKPLTSLDLTFNWQEVPEDLIAHYEQYNLGVDNGGQPLLQENPFQMEMDLLAGQRWSESLLVNQNLFNVDTNAPRTLSISGNNLTDILDSSGYQSNTELEINRYDTRSRQGFLRFTLTGPSRQDLLGRPAIAPFSAFGHTTFAAVYSEQALALARWDEVLPAPELPKEPYTPSLVDVTLNYAASTSFAANSNRDGERFFQLDAFGPAIVDPTQNPTLLPEVAGNGALFIGMEKVAPPFTASLLFQLEAGNVPGDTLLTSSQLEWSYLATNDRWETLSGNDIVLDTTDGLQQPGVIRVTLGPDAINDSGRMPGALYWLRLSTENPLGAAAITALHPRAAVATAIGTNGTEPLEPSIIGGFTRKPRGLKAVSQPYPSFGGRATEADASYFRRISERLRHRNRAVTGYDFERLVLATFPEVFKVKTLNYSDANIQIQPGQVRLIVVPDFRKFSAGNPLQPRLSRILLRQIQETLQAQVCSPFLQLAIDNPTYETLLVDCRIAFRPGFDPGFYGNQLNEDLIRFLSPWAFDEGEDIVFGGRIYRSEILAFVEGRPYVDFVAEFQLFHRFIGPSDGGISDMTINQDFIIAATPVSTIGSMTIGTDFIIGESVEIAVVARPDAILVSEANHRITALSEDDVTCVGQSSVGIGQMIIGLDFIPVT